jgi:hypothetical protein
MITYQIKAGTVDVSVVCRAVDSADGTPETAFDHATAGIDLKYRRETAANVDITEASLAALTTAHTDGGVEQIGNGYFRLDLPDAACAAGVTGVMVHGVATGMVIVGCYIQLVTYDPFDTVRLGLTALPNAIPGAAGGLIVAGTGSNQLSLDGAGNARADIQTWRGSPPDALIGGIPPVHAAELGVQAKADTNLFRKNTAVAKYVFKMVDATDLFSAETGLTVACTRSLDGAAFAATATATATEIASGWYYVPLAASDVNCDAGILRFTSAGAHPHEMVFYTTA